MADIQLRFNKDVLVLSSPIEVELARLGTDVPRDMAYMLLFEPEVLEDAYKLQQFSGAQCMVAPTAGMTPARLAHVGMTDNGAKLAKAALNVIGKFSPQHILVEIAPCGLPLDAASKQSLNENCDQYKRAAKFFDGFEDKFDAFFLNGFAKCSDLKCALIGIRKVSDKPIFASVTVGEGGADVDASGVKGGAVDDSVLSESEWSKPVPSEESLSEAIAIMAEYGAQVVGFSTGVEPEKAATLVGEIRKATYLPVLVQLEVAKKAHENVSRETSANVTTAGTPNEATDTSVSRETSEAELASEKSVSRETFKGINAEAYGDVSDAFYSTPDAMLDAAEVLYAAGVQFLRATGQATPAYTGALVAATEGSDVALVDEEHSCGSDEATETLEDVASSLRQKISAVI